MTTASFVIPRTIHHGPGSLQTLKDLTGLNRAVVVTGGDSMESTGVIQRTLDYLATAGIESIVFKGVEPDPSLETVMEGVQAIQQFEPDVILAVGGCSAIDAAKAMWVFYEYPNTVFQDIVPPFTIKKLRNKATFIAVPSTSGTGTEVTCVSVITDRSKGVKYPLVSYEITPDIAIVDGELSSSMPKNVTANTGLDALTHNVEAFVSTLSGYYTDPIAKQSISLIFEHLPVAFDEPLNIDARQIMHDASCMAGIAFTNALLGLVHAMAHQLGGMFGIPHGCANAILLPNIVRFNSLSTNKYEALAKVIGKSTAEDFAQEIENLRDRVEVPASIGKYGLDKEVFLEKLQEISENTMLDACLGANPRQPNIKQVIEIFQCCFDGRKVDF